MCRWVGQPRPRKLPMRWSSLPRPRAATLLGKSFVLTAVGQRADSSGTSDSVQQDTKISNETADNEEDQGAPCVAAISHNLVAGPSGFHREDAGRQNRDAGSISFQLLQSHRRSTWLSHGPPSSPTTRGQRPGRY